MLTAPMETTGNDTDTNIRVMLVMIPTPLAVAVRGAETTAVMTNADSGVTLLLLLDLKATASCFYTWLCLRRRIPRDVIPLRMVRSSRACYCACAILDVLIASGSPAECPHGVRHRIFMVALAHPLR